mgnify:CR=1 FL=1
MMGLIIGHPLDTIKVRQQIFPGGGKIFAVAKSTYKLEGVCVYIITFKFI